MNLKELYFNTLNIKRSSYFNRTIKHTFKAAYYHYKDWDTLIEQSPVTNTPIGQTPLTKYSKKAVTNVCELGKMWAKLGSFEQNIEQNRSEKWELLERKIGGKKSKIDSSLNAVIFLLCLPYHKEIHSKDITMLIVLLWFTILLVFWSFFIDLLSSLI